MRGYSFEEKKRGVLCFVLSLTIHLSLLLAGGIFLSGFRELPVRIEQPLMLEILGAVFQKANPIVSASDALFVQARMPEKERRTFKRRLKKSSSEAESASVREAEMEIERKIRSIREELDRAISKIPAGKSEVKPKGFQLVSGEWRGPEWNGYLGKIRKKVLEKWSPLLIELEGKFAKSEARIDFVIDSTGRVARYEVVEWKGSVQFRDLSLKSFENAMPFDAPPPAVRTKGEKAELSTLSLFFYYQ